MISLRIKEIFSSKLFLAGLMIKFICLFLFPMHFPADLFIPFFDQAVTHLGQNPWGLSPAHFFPYGGVLFSILLIPKLLLYWIFGPLALGSGPLGLFALKLPLLLLDVLFLAVLTDFASGRKASLIKYYWLNPVLFFITYLYGQLDVASMCLLTLSLYFLLKNKVTMSALMMGLASGCKFHVVICFPFFITYIWNRDFASEATKKILKWLFMSGTVFGFAFLPVILAEKGAYASLGSPEIMRLFAMKLHLTDSMDLYLGVLIVLAFLGRLIIATRITELGLVFGTGALFASLLVSSHAAPGWYYWSLPFIALFFAIYLNVPRTLFWTLNLAYFFAFASEMVPFPAEFLVLQNLSFATLQTVLIANLSFLWFIGLKREVPIIKRASSYRIGLAGDSGSGKNYLTKIIQDVFSESSTSIIEGDNYHKWERGHAQWNQFTHLNPIANHLFHLSAHVKSISRGRPISHAIYSHDTGKFTSPVELKPSKTVIVQGLHTLYFKSTRDLLDIRIFLDPHSLLRKVWKIKRDVESRNYPLEKVLTQLEKRKTDSEQFISPQANHADLIVNYFPKGEYTDAQALKGELPELMGRWIMGNDVDLSDLTEELNNSGVKAELSLNTDYPERVQLVVDGSLTAVKIEEIAHKYFSPLRHYTRGKTSPVWHEGFEGISQLLILHLVKKAADQEAI